MSDYNKYILNRGNSIEISDQTGELTELPDDFFEAYAHVQQLGFYAKSLQAIPPSIKSLTQLKSLTIYGTKIKKLPSIDEMPPGIEYIRIYDTNLIDLNNEMPMLSSLEKLETLDLGGYKGKAFPESIKFLTHLKELKFGRDLKNKIDAAKLFVFLQQMPWLEKLEIGFQFDVSCYNEDFIKLDFLQNFRCWYTNFQHHPERSPLIIGRLKHLSFKEEYSFDEIVIAFRKYCSDKTFTDTEREILFGLYIKNFTALKSIFPDLLKDNNGQFKRLCLHAKPKGESIKSINEKLSAVKLKVEKDIIGDDVIHVIGPDNEFTTTSVLIEKKQHIITIDQLQEYLIKLENPWLIQEENKEVNEQLLQLLTSDQPENYLIAFQIIDGGGANKDIQSLLAAIMTSHPDKQVHKAAEKLYVKYGSPIYKDYYDSLKISLRMSSNTAAKLAKAVAHPDIDSVVFRLMHHLIAGNNKQIKDVDPVVLDLSGASFSEFPDIIKHFGGIKKVVLDGCQKLNLDQVFSKMKLMEQLTSLYIDSAHLSIPESINTLTQLLELSLVQNELPNPKSLGSLTKLKRLNLEGVKIADWSWLPALTNLLEINIASTGCTTFPKELFSLPRLGKIEAKQNKITSVDEQFAQLQYLYYVDLSNNQFKEFPYLFFKTNKLATLMLRSNKIEVFDADKIKALIGVENNTLSTLNLSRNKLTEFSFKDVKFSVLSKLDIANNSLSELDISIFKGTILSELYASNNQITKIPEYISRSFQYLQLQNNKIEVLPAFFAHVVVRNCDLSNNLIKEIHKDFKSIGNDNYKRLYWKIKNNPIGSYYFR